MLLIFMMLTRNSSDPMSAVLIAYALLHNCLETSFVHGLHFVWVIMVMAMMNILYSQAQRPNLDVVFRAIRDRRTEDPPPVAAQPG